MAFLVNGEVHGILDALEESAIVVAMDFQVFLVKCLSDRWIFHHSHQLLVLGHAELDFGQKHVGIVFIVRRPVFLGEDVLCGLDPFAHQLHLPAIEFCHGRLQLVKHVGRDFRGTGDDQRRPGLVDEDAVDFVNDGEEIISLDEFFLA